MFVAQLNLVNIDEASLRLESHCLNGCIWPDFVTPHWDSARSAVMTADKVEYGFRSLAASSRKTSGTNEVEA
jgi:hypothetical protein